MSERIEKLIRDYPENKTQLECLKNQITSFRGITESEMIDSMQFSSPEGERVQTSNISDKTARIALDYHDRMERINREWYDHLTQQYMTLLEELRFFESAAKAVDGTAGDVLRDLVFGSMSWEEVAEKHFINRRSVGKYRKKAIEDIDFLYAQREKQMIDYMLS